jgi:hypothetical protein
LTLSDGQAVLESWPVRRQVVAQTAGPIMVVRPRLDVLGARTVFVLEGEGAVYGVRPGPRRVSRCEEAIRAHGFLLVTRRTWIDVLPRPPFWSGHNKAGIA